MQVSDFQPLARTVARKKSETRFYTPEAGLSGQKSIKRTQKYVVLGIFGHFPKISKMPVRQKNSQNRDTTENPGGDAGLSPRPVGRGSWEWDPLPAA
jgi:hypothetical protein